jgi:hypothetical protein
MNAKQKWVRALGLLVLAAMVLLPPWKISYTTANDNTSESASIGYHPLWYRVETDGNDTRTNVQQRIDVVRLCVQLGAALIVINVALVLLRTRNSH